MRKMFLEEDSEHGNAYWLADNDPESLCHSEVMDQTNFYCCVLTGDENGPFAMTEIDNESTKF